MPPTEFPLPSVNASYPIPLFYEVEVEEMVVSRHIYDDNGADYAAQAGGSGLITYTLKYNGLTAAQAAILDAHVTLAGYSSANGSASGFNFREHTIGDAAWTSVAGTLKANVHYAPGGYKKSHIKQNNCSREIILEWRP
jgi:hypothetical protein